MTQEEKRIKIAEACGAKWYHWAGDYWITFEDWSMRSRCYKSDAPSNLLFARIEYSTPDYFNDLNAMHDAETTLSDVQHNSYRMQLGVMIRNDKGRKDASMLSRRFLSSPAAQRAEAFGRALNLW